MGRILAEGDGPAVLDGGRELHVEGRQVDLLKPRARGNGKPGLGQGLGRVRIGHRELELCLFARQILQKPVESGLLPGLVYLDLLSNIEKIGDHLTNVAQAVLGNLRWNKAEKAEEPIITGPAE